MSCWLIWLRRKAPTVSELRCDSTSFSLLAVLGRAGVEAGSQFPSPSSPEEAPPSPSQVMKSLMSRFISTSSSSCKLGPVESSSAVLASEVKGKNASAGPIGCVLNKSPSALEENASAEYALELNMALSIMLAELLITGEDGSCVGQGILNCSGDRSSCRRR